MMIPWFPSHPGPVRLAGRQNVSSFTMLYACADIAYGRRIEVGHRQSVHCPAITPMRRSTVAIPRGMSTNNMRAGYRSSRAVEYTEQHSPKSKLPLPWQLCSGYADGRPWTYLGMSAQKHFKTTDPEAHLAVEPRDKPELDHAHRFRHRIDVEAVDDRHRWTLPPRWGAHVLARIPLRSARPTLAITRSSKAL